MLLRKQLKQRGQAGKQGKPDRPRLALGVDHIQFEFATRKKACYLGDSARRR